MVGLVDLGYKLVSTKDGTCYELGKERGVESKVKDVGDMGYFAFVDINNVANVLEGEEGNAHWEQDNGGIEDGLGGGV